MVTTLQRVRRSDRAQAIENRYLGNNPTNATDPSGLVESLAIDRRLLREKEARERKERIFQANWEEELFNFGSQSSRYGVLALPEKVKEKGGVFFFDGSVVMRILNFQKYQKEFPYPNQVDTWDYVTFKQGCMGLHSLRLNTTGDAFSLPGSRAFATLEAALAVQKQMISTNLKSTAIVITAYQDNYLDEDLKPFLLPGSKSEYDMAKIKGVRGPFNGIVPAKGDLEVFDYVTVHQNADLTVRYYETMDYGFTKNPELVVQHKMKLYPPNRAGTVYLVTPIAVHPRVPQSPRGEK